MYNATLLTAGWERLAQKRYAKKHRPTNTQGALEFVII